MTMKINISKNIWLKGFYWAFCFLLTSFASNAFATTEYVVLERHTDIRMFEQYLDALSTVEDPISAVRNLTKGDGRWREIGHNNANTISEIKSFNNDTLVIGNSRFGFQIYFKYTHVGDAIVWTCRIEDASIFFHPSECNDWQKSMVLHPPKNHGLQTK